jgi:hypothetical protein
VGDQLDKHRFVAFGGRFQQLDEFPGLLLGQRQRRYTKRGALGDMGTIGF